MKINAIYVLFDKTLKKIDMIENLLTSYITCIIIKNTISNVKIFLHVYFNKV